MELPRSKGLGGRPKGSKTKPTFSNYITEEQVKSLVYKAIEMAGQGNETMLKFVLEHHFGKAMQPVEGNMTGEMKIVFDKTFNQ